MSPFWPDDPLGAHKGRLLLVMVPLLIVIAFSIFLFARDQGQANRFATDLRDGLVRSCEANGNPLREAVRGQLQFQIKQSQALLHSGQYYDFFPNIPPSQLRALIFAQNSRLRKEIDSIAPVDCSSLYPKP